MPIPWKSGLRYPGQARDPDPHGDNLGLAKGTLVNFVVKYVKKLVPKYNLPHASTMRQALAKGRYLQYIKPGSITTIWPSCSTPAVPPASQGAMLTHRNLIANVEQCLGVYGPMLERGKEFVVTALPLYHVFALTVNCLLFMRIGGYNLLISNPRDIRALSKIRKYPFTCITGVNTLFNALVNNGEFQSMDFSRLKLTIGGGMAVQRAVAEQWKGLTDTPLLEGYGLTECSPLVSVCPYDLLDYNGSIGLPVCSTDIRLVDDAGQVIHELGKPGEMQVRGPQVMSGYWQR